MKLETEIVVYRKEDTQRQKYTIKRVEYSVFSTTWSRVGLLEYNWTNIDVSGTKVYFSVIV